MSRVFFLGAGATKAVASKCPLNEDLLDIALKNTGYEEINDEIRDIKKLIDRVFHENLVKLPKIEDILSFIDYYLRKKTIVLRDYTYEDILDARNYVVRIISAVLKKNLEYLDSLDTNEFAIKFICI